MNLSNFVTTLTARLNEYRERMGYTFFDSYHVTGTEGKKFFKICQNQVKDGKIWGQKSLVVFIDKETGDIYKPASWNAPAKHARGNVLSAENGMEAFTVEGNVKYLK